MLSRERTYKLLAAFVAVMLLTVLLLILARQLGAPYVSAVPAAISAFQRAITLAGRTNDFETFMLVCFKSMGVGLLFFLSCSAFIWVAAASVLSISSAGVSNVAAIAEVVWPIAAVTAMFNITIFLFELEGINTNPYGPVPRVTSLSAIEDARNDTEAMIDAI